MEPGFLKYQETFVSAKSYLPEQPARKQCSQWSAQRYVSASGDVVALSIVAAATGADVIYESSSSSSIGLSSSTEDWRTAFLRPPATAGGRLSVCRF